jgi:hypothetical protein
VDLDGDGRPDLLAVGPDGLLFHRGNGDGTFAAPKTYAIGGGYRLVTGDFDGDGKLDVAASDGGSSVIVTLGKSLGTARSFTVGAGPLGLAAADLNGDGKLDLVVANSTSTSTTRGTVSVLLGNGDGTFAPKVDYAAGWGPMDVAIGDVNEDGKLDLVVAAYYASTGYSGGNVAILLGQGDGTFRPQTLIDLDLNLSSIALVDLDRDGHLDIAATSSGDGSPPGREVAVAFGVGDGTFSGGTWFRTGVQPVAIAAADLDGDGNLDLVTADSGSYGASVLVGLGARTFATREDYAVGAQPSGVAVADFDGDGKKDLAVASSYDATLRILRGVGNAEFSGARHALIGAAPVAATAGDLDGDGRADLIVLDASGLVVVRGGAGLALGAPIPANAGAGLTAATVADVNRDGKADVIATDGVAGTVRVLLGNGDGTLGAPSAFPACAGPVAVAAADLDGDGAPDLAVACRSAKVVSILHGNGDGSFGAATDLAVADGAPNGVAFVDATGDGKLDLLVSADYGADLFPGNGDGTFGAVQRSTTYSGPAFAAIGDLDGGAPEIVVAKSNAVVDVKKTMADLWPTSFNVAPTPSALALADLDGDGKQDIVLLSTVSSGGGWLQTSILPLSPTAAEGRYPVPGSPVGLVVADFDGDGRPDVAVANARDESVRVYANRCP